MNGQRRRFLRLFYAASAATAATATLLAVYIGPKPPTGCIAPAVLCVSTTGSDATGTRGDLSKPFKTFNAAIGAAVCGDDIQALSGAYAAQTISDHVNTDACTTGTMVTIEPVPGSTVNVSGLTVGSAGSYPSFIIVRGFHVPYGSHMYVLGGHHVTVLNDVAPYIDMLGTNDLNVTTNTTDVTISGGTYGYCQATASEVCVLRLAGTRSTIDGATFYGTNSSNPSLFHTEDIFVRGCNSCTIRNSTFYDTYFTDILVQNCCAGLPVVDGLTVENNWFGAGYSDTISPYNPQATLEVDTSTPSLIIRHNSTYHWCITGTTTKCASSLTVCAGDGIADMIKTGTSCGTVASPALVYGNLMGNKVCATDTTYNYNVVVPFSGTTGQTLCGVTDTKIASTAVGYQTDPAVPTCAPPYLSSQIYVVCQGPVNFTLTGATQTADNFVTDATYCVPTTDHAGNARAAVNCDAGASER